MQTNATKVKWYKRKWVWVLAIAFVLFMVIGATNSGSNKQAGIQEGNKTADNNTTGKQAPHFADYLNKPMADVAKEFGQTYDAANSTQLHAEKDGYKLFFEDGGRITGTTKENTGKVNITNIELAPLGKCEQGQVYDKIDEAMQLTGLNPTTKGDKHEGMGGTQQGYGAYRNYKGDKSLELALLCDYNGDNYKLQLRVLPEYR